MRKQEQGYCPETTSVERKRRLLRNCKCRNTKKSVNNLTPTAMGLDKRITVLIESFKKTPFFKTGKDLKERVKNANDLSKTNKKSFY